MADQGRWFKLWCSVLDDPDLANLSLEDFGRWCLLGVLVKVHGTEGRLRIEAPAFILQRLFRVESFEAVILVLDGFPHCTIRRDDDVTIDNRHTLHIEFSNWRKYQVDSSTERMRQKRARDARHVTVKKRGEEKRGEETKKRLNPLTPLAELWNARCPTLPAVSTVSKGRREKERVRLSERGLEEWHRIFVKLEASAFCHGQNDRQWVATFDWIIKNEENAIKTLEGKYDGRPRTGSGPLRGVAAFEAREKARQERGE